MKKLILIMLLTSNLFALAPTSSLPDFENNLHGYVTKYINQKNTSFVETKMLDRYIQFDNCYKEDCYDFYRNGLKRVMVVMKNGKIKLSGDMHNMNGEYKFVVDKNLNIYAYHPQYGLYHSSFSGGKPIVSGGTIHAFNGTIIGIDNYTGHYQVTFQNFLPIFNALKKIGVEFDDLVVNNKYQEFKFILYTENNKIIVKTYDFRSNDFSSYEKTIKVLKKMDLKLDSKTLKHIKTTIKNVDKLKLSYEMKEDLRLIMCFHDLGKSEKGLHEINSVEIMKKVYFRGFYNSEVELFTKIIKYHNELGIFPKNNYDLSLLSKNELNYLHYATLCDITGRPEFDTIQNKKRINDLVTALKNKDTLKLKKKIRNINFLLKKHFKVFYSKNPIIYYRLKDILYSFEFDNLSKIAFAV